MFPTVDVVISLMTTVVPSLIKSYLVFIPIGINYHIRRNLRAGSKLYTRAAFPVHHPSNLYPPDIVGSDGNVPTVSPEFTVMLVGLGIVVVLPVSLNWLSKVTVYVTATVLEAVPLGFQIVAAANNRD